LGLSIRYYIFPPGQAPQSLSRRVVEGLTSGDDAMPAYADTRQRILMVVLENDDGEPTQAIRAEGMIWTFDAEGRIREGLQDSIRDFMDVAFSPPHGDTKQKAVVDLVPEIRKRRLAERYRWQPTTDDLQAVANDIWPKGGGTKLKAAKGSAPRKPRATYEAKQALREISGPF
jgi:hypothetical protein